MADTTSILSYIGVALGVWSTLFTAINRHRIRSTCCGFKGEASLDIGELTPEHPPSLNLSSAPVDVEAGNPNLQQKPVDCKEDTKVSQ